MLKIAWSEAFAHSLPANHRFPMEKYSLIPDQLLYEGTISEANLFHPETLPETQIVRTHDSIYWQKLKHQTLSRLEARKTGFPVSAALVERERIIMQGTVDAANYACKNGIGMNLAGGTHHAFTNRGEGFCLLNDIAIAANALLDVGLASKILVIDLDVHQGNGTAEIFSQEKRVFTFSMHGEKNYPMHKEKSDLDVELKDGLEDKEYLKILDHHLKSLFDQLTPDFVFFQSGVDVLATDKLGRLGLTINGCMKRDEMVLNICHQNKVPIAICMGGGYSSNIKHIVEAHANTYRLAQEIFF